MRVQSHLSLPSERMRHALLSVPVFLLAPLVLVLICSFLSLTPLPAEAQSSLQSQVKVIKIGAIFEGSDGQLESIFRQTVDRINLDKSRMSKPRLEAQVARINHRDSFHAAKLACQLIEGGVWAVFGPQSPSVAWLIRSIADNLHVPHFLMTWDYRSFRRFSSNMTLNLHPEPTALSSAFADLVVSRKWKSFALVYEEDEQLIRLKDLLRVSNVKMLIRQLPTSSAHFTKLFKDIKKTGETNVVLSISNDKISDVLSAAREIGLLTDYNNYIIASLDVHLMDLTDFSSSNISGLTLDSMAKKSLRIQEALLTDAVWLFVAGLDQLDRTAAVTPPTLTCESKSPWAFGRILVNLMKVVNVRGLTGHLRFDQFGQRSQFTLDILELKKSTFIKTGSWNPISKINITRNYTEEQADIKEVLRNKTLRVTIPTNAEPYAMWKENARELEGNARFEGYCIDLVDEIAEVLGFRYELYPAPNNAYGKVVNGEWDGMIRELLDRRADMAIADLTITHQRQSAVDFTLPFMNLGISIMFKKPEQVPPDLFSFLKPFSVDVWLYVLTAIIGVTMLLYVISRLSPYEWVSGHPCEDDPDELENQFSLGNCLWFALGSIMQQGSDLAPRALSTRTLASIWWFFTLIMISSYTANLAAFLTVSRMSAPIENAEDLAKQSIIQYGCKEGGSTYNFFKTSNHSTYERMWSTMESIRPSVFVEDNTKGIDRVKKGNYAFLMESTTIEYEVQRNCDLVQIGGLLDQKGYGIATPPDSPYRGLLSEAILHLQETGRLIELKNRWWVQKIISQGITCPPDPVSTMKLDIGNVGGVFVVLLAGTGFGCVVVVLEFIWKAKKVARHERDNAVVMMWRELVRICSGGGGHRTTGEASAIGNESSSRSSRSDAGTGTATGTAIGSNSARDAVVPLTTGERGGNNSNSEYFLPTSGSFS